MKQAAGHVSSCGRSNATLVGWRIASPPLCTGRLLIALAAGASGACGGAGATAPGDPSRGQAFLRAVVTARSSVDTIALGDTYEGTGAFAVNDARPRAFTIASQATDGQGDRGFLVTRNQGENTDRLAVGKYAVAPPDYAKPSWDAVSAIYTRVTGGWREAYVGSAGSVTVTRSTSEHVAGTFTLTAVRYYRRPLPGLAAGQDSSLVLGRPNAIPPGQPTVVITGSFAADPLRTEIITAAPQLPFRPYTGSSTARTPRSVHGPA